MNELNDIKMQIDACAIAMIRMRANEDAIDYSNAIASIMKYCAHRIECEIYDIAYDAIDSELRDAIETINRDFRLNISFID